MGKADDLDSRRKETDASESSSLAETGTPL
jgi:hypothetical protein